MGKSKELRFYLFLLLLAETNFVAFLNFSALLPSSSLSLALDGAFKQIEITANDLIFYPLRLQCSHVFVLARARARHSFLCLIFLGKKNV